MSLWPTDPQDTEAGAEQQPPARRPGQTWVVHVNRAPYDVYIGRAVSFRPDLSPEGWGNPFQRKLGMNPVAMYREYLLSERPDLVGRLRDLKGKTLACWCAPAGGLPGDLRGHTCHGEVLAALADLLPEHPARVEWDLTAAREAAEEAMSNDASRYRDEL